MSHARHGPTADLSVASINYSAGRRKGLRMFRGPQGVLPVLCAIEKDSSLSLTQIMRTAVLSFEIKNHIGIEEKRGTDQ
jgi:hypothetical protein